MTIDVKNEEMTDTIPFETIKEITGISDRTKITNTWRNCSQTTQPADIMRAVIESLIGSVQPQQDNITAGAVTYDQATQIPKSVIDLTTDGEQDDMQKAIAASLADSANSPTMLGGNFSREEADISRVLEATMHENNKKMSSQMWLPDPLNPYERMRPEGKWPVGLKNVGNTCWFNAVIQSLFHISKFRNLVLHYKPCPTVNKENQMYKFMCELRKLFALLLCCNRKYLDPSSALNIFRQSFNADNSMTHDGQQDVSEFQHRLIDWLEEAFKFDADDVKTEDESMEIDPPVLKEKDERNHMIQLFYGKVRISGINAGNDFISHPDFGQWPLQVAGFSDIHDSLEASLAQGDIETNNETQKSTQEQWFTRLPPVLTFELSRFEFRSELTRVEKLHNRFSFPEEIFLDRYMECNKQEVSEKRKKMKQFKTELSTAKSLLSRYTNYKQDPEAIYPLSDILDCALKFTNTTGASDCTECTCLQEQTITGLQQPSTSSKAVTLPKKITCTCPRPAHITDDERSTLTKCLTRWREEVIRSVSAYENKIEQISTAMDQTYEQDNLKNHKYQLHAVLVHEGQAASGHYWSYIYCRKSKSWIKYNDTNVTASTWDEVKRESEGGRGAASAYCLMYINPVELGEKAQELQQPATGDTAAGGDELTFLPADLREAVVEDQRLFNKEMIDWSEKRERTRIAQCTDGGDGDPDIISVHKPSTDIPMMSDEDPNDKVLQCANDHATTLTKAFFKYAKQTASESDPRIQLEKIISELEQRFTQALEEADERADARTHMPVYLMAVYQELDKSYLRYVFADLISRMGQDVLTTERHMTLVREAKKRVLAFKQSSAEFDMVLRNWHMEFHMFRVVVSLFVYALTEYLTGKYESALPLFHEAYRCNEHIMTPPNMKTNLARGLSRDLIGNARIKCLEKFTEQATSQFEQEEDYKAVLEVIINSVLPILDGMQASNRDADVTAANSVKDRWVAYLGEELDEQRTEALNEFLTLLFEGAAHTTTDLSSSVIVPNDLGSQYKAAMESYLKAIEQ